MNKDTDDGRRGPLSALDSIDEAGNVAPQNRLPHVLVLRHLAGLLNERISLRDMGADECLRCRLKGPHAE